MSQWYYADAQRERHGPVEADVLRDKFRRNELDLGSLVWREGMSQWQPLSAMAEELQLLVPAAAGTGIDLRADYQAIEDGSAVAKASAAAQSPYAAPTSAATGEAVVGGGEIVYAGFWKRVAAYFIDTMGIPNLRVAGKTDYVFDFRIGVSRRYPLLFRAVRKALDAIPEDERKAIRDEWISLEADPGLDPETRRLLWLAGWFLAVNSVLGGRRPQDLLATKPERVIAAAQDEMDAVARALAG